MTCCLTSEDCPKSSIRSSRTMGAAPASHLATSAGNCLCPPEILPRKKRFVVQCTGLPVRVSKRNTTASMWERLREHSRYRPRNTGGQVVHHLWCRKTCTLMGDHVTRSPWRVYRSSSRKMTRLLGASRSPSTSECSPQPQCRVEAQKTLRQAYQAYTCPHQEQLLRGFL